MKGSVIAANRNLGMLVVKHEAGGYVLLTSANIFALNVGDQVEGEWARAGETVMLNATTGHQVHVHVEQFDLSQGEAIGALSMF